MTDVRPPIPEATKRAIRKRSGFGCVVCGMPIYDYEHLQGFATVKRHVVKEMTLLCPQHHREKTNGLLPLQQLQEFVANPHNLRKGTSAPYQFNFHRGRSLVLTMANLRFVAPTGAQVMIPILINEYAPLNFILRENELLMNFGLVDESGNDVFRVKDNVMVYSANQWDLTFIGRTLTIRQAAGTFILELQFNPPNGVSLRRCSMSCGNYHVAISPEEIQFSGYPQGQRVILKGGEIPPGGKSGIISGEVGVLIGKAPPGLGVALNASMDPPDR